MCWKLAFENKCLCVEKTAIYSITDIIIISFQRHLLSREQIHDQRISYIYWQKKLPDQFVHHLLCWNSVHSMDFGKTETGGNLKTQERTNMEGTVKHSDQDPVTSVASSLTSPVCHCHGAKALTIIKGWTLFTVIICIDGSLL